MSGTAVWHVSDTTCSGKWVWENYVGNVANVWKTLDRTDTFKRLRLFAIREEIDYVMYIINSYDIGRASNLHRLKQQLA